MSVLVDTSGILAVLDDTDRRHAEADVAWSELLAGSEPLVWTSYTLIETYALAQNRLGMSAVRALRDKVYPALDVVWVDAELHEAGLSAVLAAGRRHLSLVDSVSFEVMRRRSITRAFTFDPHFCDQGFDTLP